MGEFFIHILWRERYNLIKFPDGRKTQLKTIVANEIIGNKISLMLPSQLSYILYTKNTVIFRK